MGTKGRRNHSRTGAISGFLQDKGQAGRDKQDAVGKRRDLLIEAACGITKMAAKRRLGNEAHADLVGDEHHRSGGIAQGSAQSGRLRFGSSAGHKQVGQPQCQAIDEYRAVRRRLGQKGGPEVERDLDRAPEGAAERSMRGNTLGHLGIAGFGSRTVGAALGGALNELLRVAALARPGAAQHQSHTGKPRVRTTR